MRFVKVERTASGYLLDPNLYLDQLAGLAAALPPGALKFAREPGHYDVHSSRCVKDLKFGSLSLVDELDRLSLEMWFQHNEFRHGLDLVIRYHDVTNLSVTATSSHRLQHVWPETRRLGDFQLDEILPGDGGCTHEIQMTGGTIKIACADLVAEWRPVSSRV